MTDFKNVLCAFPSVLHSKYLAYIESFQRQSPTFVKNQKIFIPSPAHTAPLWNFITIFGRKKTRTAGFLCDRECLRIHLAICSQQTTVIK